MDDLKRGQWSHCLHRQGHFEASVKAGVSPERGELIRPKSESGKAGSVWKLCLLELSDPATERKQKL